MAEAAMTPAERTASGTPAPGPEWYDDSRPPLSYLTPFFLDYESVVSEELTLRNMTLWQYLMHPEQHVTALTACIGPTEEPQIYMPWSPGVKLPDFAQPYDERIINVMRQLANDSNFVWVAHNAAFDTRVANDLEDIPWPHHVWCTMEGAMGAWPEFPGGYSLHNLTDKLCAPEERKFSIDLKVLKYWRNCARQKPVRLKEVAPDMLEVMEAILATGGMKLKGSLTTYVLDCVLALYNRRDVVGHRSIYYKQVNRLSAYEQRVALRTHHQRQFKFEIDAPRLDAFIDKMNENAEYAAKAAEEYVGQEDLDNIFNRQSDMTGGIGSIRYARLKKIVNDNLVRNGDTFESTSFKKASPVLLARNPDAAGLLSSVNDVGKMISHKRNSQRFRGVSVAHVELGYMRAHTGRFSSPGCGGAKSLNIHNCVSIATPVLTEQGWVRIGDLKGDEKVWTGTCFSPFAGVQSEGQRETVRYGGTNVTPEQPILVNNKRVVLQDASALRQYQGELFGFRSALMGVLACPTASVREEAEARIQAKTPGATLASALVWVNRALTEPEFWDTYTELMMRGGYVETLTGLPVPEPEIGELVEVVDLLGVKDGGVYQAAGVVVFNCPKHQKAVAKPLRQIFRLPSHLCFVRGDLANLEFRVEGALTNCTNILKMFVPSMGGNLYTDPYITNWKFMTGMEITKKDPIRQVSKCLAEGTPVWTDGGKVAIEKVSDEDSVYDGATWVTHGGVVFSGLKDCVEIDGVWMTLDHLVLVAPGEWKEAWQLAVNTRFLNMAKSLARGSASQTPSPSRTTGATTSGTSSAGVLSPALSAMSGSSRSLMVRQRGAQQRGLCSATFTGTPTSCQTSSSVLAGSTAYPRSSVGAQTRQTPGTRTMVAAESQSTRNGSLIGANSFAMFRPLRVGRFLLFRSIESITARGTSKATSDALRWPSTHGIGETTRRCSTKGRGGSPKTSGSSAPNTARKTLSVGRSEKDLQRIKSLLTRRNVEVRTKRTYDVTDAGPRTRYVVGNGLIVHNSAALGLGFCMQVIGYAEVLLKVLGDKNSGVTEDTLRKIIIDNRWMTPKGDIIERVLKALGCSTVVALASYHIHRVFNMTYHEFERTAKWLVRAIGSVASCGGGQVGRDEAKRVIDMMYSHSQDAPDRNMIGLEIDSDGISSLPVVRVRCGPYPATVCWREPAMRLLDFQGANKRTQLTILKATTGPKGFSPQLAIENVAQAASRNGVCDIVESLEKQGYPDAIHIHDEILMIVPRTRAAVLAARDAMIKAAGPGHALTFGWALLIKPEEITVTQTLWEEEIDIMPVEKGGKDRWGMIERGDPDMFKDLP